MTQKKPPSGSSAGSDAGYRAELERTKHASTIQVLFKVARLFDELAIARVAVQKNTPQLRRSHTSLLPHIALEGTRITELADKLGISKQAVSQLVDELEALGVLAKTPDPDDARARRVVFTERGRAGLLEGLRVLRDLEAEFARQIGPKHMAELREALLLLLDRLESTQRASEGNGQHSKVRA